MGAQESEAMKRARELIVGPRQLTPYKAAVEAGITRGAISKAKWYREFVASKQQGDKSE